MRKNVGIRIHQARKAAGLNLRKLGELMAISHTAVKKYEDGILYPSSDTLIKFAKVLGVKIDFFFRPIKVSLESVKFRKRKKLTIKVEEAIKLDIINKIERRLELENFYPSPPYPLFNLSKDLPEQITNWEDIENVAQKLRLDWNLGFAPIHNLIEAFEDHGIRVFTTDIESEHFDGLSTVINEQPIIVISSKWPGDRQRFNLVHELAHYIFINRLSSDLNEERACNRLAGAFLFPRDAVIQEIGNKPRRAIELQELYLLKTKYHLSMGAICYRLKDLNVIEEKYYRTLVICFRKKGWNRTEPGLQVPQESSFAFNKLLFHALGEEYIGESKAAELLSCTIPQLKAIRQVQNGNAITHYQRC